jgi:hypothetical protein
MEAAFKIRLDIEQALDKVHPMVTFDENSMKKTQFLGWSKMTSQITKFQISNVS